jgi:RNA polymerase sigma factor (TIGR02999 family)
VHEAYLKLNGIRERQFNDETHLLAVASRIMRQILVDYARSRTTQKRLGPGGSEPLWSTADMAAFDRGPGFREVVELDDALAALSAENEILGRLIEMRYFGGMTAEQSAKALGMSVHVVRHHLRFAQAWLRKRLSS